jgi:hypothetical protein
MQYANPLLRHQSVYRVFGPTKVWIFAAHAFFRFFNRISSYLITSLGRSCGILAGQHCAAVPNFTVQYPTPMLLISHMMSVEPALFEDGVYRNADDRSG